MSPFAAPPAALVVDGRQQFGRFSAGTRANLIDAAYRSRFVRRMRLKEWQAVQITSPTLFINVALFDAKLLQLVQVKIYDRVKGKKHLFERKCRPGAFRIADQIADSTNTHGGLTFTNRVAERITIAIDVPEIRGEVTLHTARGASQVVSMPLHDGVGMYSHKGMFPAEGELTIHGERHLLATTDSLALLDDHKGYYPYVMKWDWVTSAAFDANGTALGFNLTRNQCPEPDRYGENCAWIGDRVGALPAVTFERVHVREPGERWHIRDREGKVAIEFEPTVPGDLKMNALVIESRYRGPFGKVTGTLAPDGLPPITVDGWFGMGEEFWLRC